MGLGTARAACNAGAEVIVAGRRPVEARSGDGGSLKHAVVDFTDETSVRSLYEGMDSLDHLFVSASPASRGPSAFLEQDGAAARAFMEGKLFGCWLCARYAAAKIRPGGSITFVSGVASIRPGPGLTMVSTTFAAVEQLSRALAVEIKPIRVNTIRPGVIDSDMWTFLDDSARERLHSRISKSFPAGRVGKIEDIGHAAVFLMTNSYVTGSVIEVTGGEQFTEPSSWLVQR